MRVRAPQSVFRAPWQTTTSQCGAPPELKPPFHVNVCRLRSQRDGVFVYHVTITSTSDELPSKVVKVDGWLKMAPYRADVHHGFPAELCEPRRHGRRGCRRSSATGTPTSAAARVGCNSWRDRGTGGKKSGVRPGSDRRCPQWCDAIGHRFVQRRSSTAKPYVTRRRISRRRPPAGEGSRRATDIASCRARPPDQQWRLDATFLAGWRPELPACRRSRSPWQPHRRARRRLIRRADPAAATRAHSVGDVRFARVLEPALPKR